ncbi:putative bifunctional diguanylate cyclase/phosphodiesterase [Virgibacillus kekensis]|uniref:Bifunctional diguanylate cyclase/phosphodiesterase n=1 Tax=Virgibacillus kekensis TaxID=202261 RepID=A0ABV9DKT7_9BACI
MKYTWRIVCTAILLVSNIISVYFAESLSPLQGVFLFANLFIGWFIGWQIDKYLHSKRELGSTRKTLVDYSYALDSAADAIGVLNGNGEVEFANDALLKLYGYQHGELLDLNWRNFVTEEYHDSLLAITNSEQERSRAEVVGVTKEGRTFPMEIAISHIKETQKIIGVVRDISKQKQHEEYMIYISEHNELTKLPNRRRLHKDLAVCENQLMDTSILFIDLDRFKITNDTLGHDIGDELLKGFAERLTYFNNEFTEVYHLGGDEFIVLIKRSSTEYIESVVNDLLESLQEPFYIVGNQIIITSSIGISIYPEHTGNINELLKYADTAMYYAKLSGKNTYKFFNDDLKLQLDRRAFLEAELRKAINNDELHICYQPKYRLSNRELVGMEALIRWENSTLGPVMPMDFIPLAEDIGLINEIGKWVIKEVLVTMNTWMAKGYPLVKVSVNVSQKQFRSGELVQYIESCLNAYEIDAQYLEVEITESVLEDSELVIPQLNELKDMGVGISIDDFGTGYSSLSLIKDLPIDTLKIDRSFLRDALSNQKESSIVKAILNIGHTLNLNMVAEGIETEEQLKLLLELNCPDGQGYFFSKPLPPDELEETVLNGTFVQQ